MLITKWNNYTCTSKEQINHIPAIICKRKSFSKIGIHRQFLEKRTISNNVTHSNRGSSCINDTTCDSYRWHRVSENPDAYSNRRAREREVQIAAIIYNMTTQCNWPANKQLSSATLNQIFIQNAEFNWTDLNILLLSPPLSSSQQWNNVSPKYVYK